MVRRLSLVWLAAAAIWTSSAFARPQDPREIQARKDCLTGNYESGVALLAELFAETENANFIYNQARCYEQSARPEDAINRFREYLRVAKYISAAERSDVDQHIAECRTLQKERDKKAATATGPSPAPVSMGAINAPPPTPAVPMPPAAKPAETLVVPAVTPTIEQVSPIAAPVPPVSAAVVEQPSNPVPTSQGKRLRVAGIVCGAVGLASLGTATYYYARAKSLSDKVSNANPGNPSDFQAGKDAETMQWVLYSIGASAAATGVVLYLLGQSGSAAPASVGMIPIAAPGIAGLSAQGVF